jgi:hypothetical protein
MRTSLLASILAITASTVVTAQYTNQSAPFKLVLHSSNVTYDGACLSPCHEGAAVEALCPSGPASTYTFNTSSNSVSYNASIGETGYLTYELSGGNFNVSEPMALSYDPTTNIAAPLFSPAQLGGTLVAFDCNENMNIQGYVNENTSPLTEVPYYRWYVCTTFKGYTYNTLVWTMGAGEPEDPSCVKVEVQRVFV